MTFCRYVVRKWRNLLIGICSYNSLLLYSVDKRSFFKLEACRTWKYQKIHFCTLLHYNSFQFPPQNSMTFQYYSCWPQTLDLPASATTPAEILGVPYSNDLCFPCIILFHYESMPLENITSLIYALLLNVDALYVIYNIIHMYYMNVVVLYNIKSHIC